MTTNRRLAAIMVADVVGYGHLAGQVLMLSFGFNG